MECRAGKRKTDASINRGEGVRIGVMRALNRQSELELKHSKALRVTRVRMIPVFQTGALTAGTCVAHDQAWLGISGPSAINNAA